MLDVSPAYHPKQTETVSRPEDFDIVEDDDELPRRLPSWWLWLGGAALLIIFAGVFAFSVFSQRVSNPSPGPVVNPPATATPAESGQLPPGTPLNGTPNAGMTPEGTPSPSPTPIATATETPTPTPTVEPSPTPCAIAVDDAFTAMYSITEMGCAVNQPRVVWSAWQEFERGKMFWRQDTDQAFVLSNSGIYSPVTERWDGSPATDRGIPPAGFVAPERGFGFVWSRSDEIFNLLGWGIDREKGFCARVQDFDYGFMVMSDPVPSCTGDNLYNNATAGDWQPLYFRLTESGIWR